MGADRVGGLDSIVLLGFDRGSDVLIWRIDRRVLLYLDVGVLVRALSLFSDFFTGLIEWRQWGHFERLLGSFW